MTDTQVIQSCWEQRGCDEQMRSQCPHNTPGESCPVQCRYAECCRSTHVICDDVGILLNPDRDYDAAVKEVCRFCEHFLVYGPDRASRSVDSVRRGNPNRFLL